MYAKDAITKTESALYKYDLKERADWDSVEKDNNNREQLREYYMRNVYTTMSISYYNLGVEHEHLNEYSHSLDAFNKALQIIQEKLRAEQ